MMMLGKRKRDTRVVSKRGSEEEKYESNATSTMDVNDIFRRHFEASFAPLPEQESDQDIDEESDGEDGSDAESEVSDWSGLSESDHDIPVVEVVDHAVAENGDGDEFHRARLKAFMVRPSRLTNLRGMLIVNKSSRPPREIDATAGTKQTKALDEDDPIDKLNLKHDLDLQRLLKESHLLEKSKVSKTPAKERQMALEMRLQALGAKTSVLTQESMPRSHRIGITKKADQKEARRRREAKENGVILEKASSKSNKNVRRQRGVDVPGVGKFSGGTLKLSRKDVASIQGPPSGTSRKGKRR
ncbi:pre-rRNA processing and 40S ribosomal subunit assembly [Knufia obscura]|uniref:Pre-rRNA processing and 40S ribosomal subunit assembly n=1 Tax=Knufia obscura TaxID=1635080 RepID=A0ABR0RN61_9EURO|nr:pre-rRNA processing and 40S ribosomal subunit assembly [Knufia obscura]